MVAYFNTFVSQQMRTLIRARLQLLIGHRLAAVAHLKSETIWIGAC